MCGLQRTHILLDQAILVINYRLLFLLGVIIDTQGGIDTSISMQEDTYPEWKVISDVSPRPAYRATGDNMEGRQPVFTIMNSLMSSIIRFNILYNCIIFPPT